MTFKVLSYNINCGGNDRLSLITEVIRAQRADVVALLEANSQSTAEALAHRLDMHLVYGQANSEFGIAWLSHPPIVDSRNHRLKVLAKTLLEIVVIWQGIPLSLFATHLIHGCTAADAHQRTKETQAILDVLHPLANSFHLLVGDFNAIHPSDPIGNPPPGEKKAYTARHPIRLILGAGYVDCFQKRHANVLGYTYPAHQPWLRLDYIFASPSMAARLCTCDVVQREETKRASDHLPIWAEFK
jgi:endonuclease/exonuclease/phosphatase family metal-dependent hydrolase